MKEEEKGLLRRAGIGLASAGLAVVLAGCAAEKNWVEVTDTTSGQHSWISKDASTRVFANPYIPTSRPAALKGEFANLSYKPEVLNIQPDKNYGNNDSPDFGK